MIIEAFKCSSISWSFYSHLLDWSLFPPCSLYPTVLPDMLQTAGAYAALKNEFGLLH